MPEETKKGDQKDIEETKVIAAIGYIWILALIPLFLKRGSPFARFHGKQGLVLFIIEILGWLVYWIPIIGPLFAVLLIILAILGFVQALSGKYWEMPIIGQFAKRINL